MEFDRWHAIDETTAQSPDGQWLSLPDLCNALNMKDRHIGEYIAEIEAYSSGRCGREHPHQSKALRCRLPSGHGGLCDYVDRVREEELLREEIARLAGEIEILQECLGERGAPKVILFEEQIGDPGGTLHPRQLKVRRVYHAADGTFTIEVEK